MATIFSETLVRMRKEAGYATAYRFFHDNGGAPVLKVTYRNYLMMEQGRNLPVLERLQKILVGLQVPQSTPAARDLTLAWLKTMAGPDSFAYLLEPLLNHGAQAASASPVEEALRRSLAGQKYHITLKQVLPTITSFEAYKCFFIIETDTGAWTPEAMAKAVGMKKAAAEKILKEFFKVGLVKAEAKGAYRSRIAGKLVEYPESRALPEAVLAKIKGYFGRLERESPAEFAQSGLVRADADAMRGYYPMMRSTVEASYAFSTTKKTRKSAGFFVVSRVHRLFDF